MCLLLGERSAALRATDRIDRHTPAAPGRKDEFARMNLDADEGILGSVGWIEPPCKGSICGRPREPADVPIISEGQRDRSDCRIALHG